MQEYWVNVYRNPTTNSAHLGTKHINKEFCIKCSRLDDWVPIYRIHVKMKPVKQNMKIFGVDILGVYTGDGALKRITEFADKSDWMG